MADQPEVEVLLTAGELLLLRQRLSDGPGIPAADSVLDAKLCRAQKQLPPWGMEPCPCGRPDLGSHEKPTASWLCRAAYLEKEIGYALSELGRGGEWPAAGMQRLEKLAGTGGNHG